METTNKSPGSIDRVPGSFRDPSGYLFLHDGTLYRSVAASHRDDYEAMMASGFYEAAVATGRLIPHVEVADVPGTDDAYKVLRPERVPFISYPYEWCFSQLKDGGGRSARRVPGGPVGAKSRFGQ